MGDEVILRKDLPEELRGYSNGHEVIKQFAHARKFANATETRLKTMMDEVEKAQAENARLQNELKAKTSTPGAPALPGYTAVPSPALPVAMSVDETALQSAIDNIETIDDLAMDPDAVNRLKATMKVLASSIKDLHKDRAVLQSELGKAKQYADEKIEPLSKSLTKYEEAGQLAQKEKEERAQSMAAIKEVEALQNSFSELKTVRPCFGAEGTDTVEAAVLNFANRVNMVRAGRRVNNWAEANAIVNRYNRDDPELKAFCANQGIRPEDVGLGNNDMINYATIVNTMNLAKGLKYNEYTGELEQMKNSFGQAVNFPTMSAAYQYLQTQTGIPRMQQQEALALAETRGVQKLEAALQRGASSAKPIGSEGAAGPESQGDQMTAEQAESILSKIDEAEMEKRGMEGDRKLWNTYTKAWKIVTGQEIDVPAYWPSVSAAA
jgi:hypothetical protein